MVDFTSVDYSIAFEDPIDQVICARAKKVISVICPNYPGGVANSFDIIVSEILKQLQDYSQFQVTKEQVEKVVFGLYNKWWNIFVQEVNQDDFWWSSLEES